MIASFKRVTTLSITIYTLLLSVLISLFLKDQPVLLSIINVSFIFALPLVIIGGFLFVTEKGVFNVFLYGSRRFFKSINKKTEDLIEDEISHSDDKDLLYREWNFQWTSPFLRSGVLIAVVSTVLSFIYVS